MNLIGKHIARIGLLGALPGVVGMAVLPPAWAQEATANNGGLAEVVVTAQKRTQNLQKASIAVTAVTGEKINEQGLTDAGAVLKDIPNVVVQATARGQAISIRGLGSDLPPGMGESAVSTNYDGIYSARSEANTIGFFDLGRVEVLRGPQSTLYGRNATGGVMNVISANPTFDKLSGYTTGEIGNYNLKRVETMLNVPISDKWAARLAYANIDRKGFFSNGGGDAVGDGFRGKLLYKNGDDTSVLLAYEHNKTGGKGNTATSATYFNAGTPYKNDYSSDISQSYESDKYWVQADVKVGPGTLTFLPSYQEATGHVVGDMGMGFPEVSDDPKLTKTTALDLRYASLADSPVQWVAGLYYYDFSSRSTSEARGSDNTDKTKSTALYGQVTFPLAADLRGIVGLRASSDKKGYLNSVSAASGSFTASSHDYKLSLEYDVNPTSLMYATLASGHRPGGWDNMTTASPTQFKEESLTSFELGSKNRFNNGKVQLNSALFYYDYKDYQLVDFYFYNGDIVSRFLNVPKVKNYGLELEGKARVADNTTVNASLTYLNSTFGSDFTIGGTDSSGNTVVLNMNGKSMPHAPRWTIKSGIEQGFDLGDGASLTGKLDLRWVDAQYVANYPAEDELQKAYVQADASVIYRPSSEAWSLNLYVKNMTNKIIKTAYAAGEISVGNPRQYGLVLNVKY